ncbi:hypothetical protein KQY27_03220 [Methanobrevibacter sp. TMH8]|uniref:hypothetical protein n=1 Tax=Methanobrevibacter sp. TMH8 TaxID=2848611 RepID=UPI001CCF0DC7|nr:hypothetical protein [Methanobrevibacter sp. TMH8]MBZ9570555.1 hypothetical protein [Methanobrevibacter sp. TMH8]
MHFVKLYEDYIIKGEIEGQFFIEIETQSVDDNNDNLKQFNRKLKRLVEIVKILGKSHECYENLNIIQYLNKEQNMVFAQANGISVNTNIEYSTKTFDENEKLIESSFCDKYGHLKVINHETNEVKDYYPKIETNLNENNYHVQNALDYMADSDEKNIYFKVSNAFEAIEEFFKENYDDVNNENEFYEKLTDLKIVKSVKECKRFARTLNAKNDLEGRHHHFGEFANGMTKDEIKECVNKILKYVLTS